MPDDEIVVAVNGSNYVGWKAADVTCSMDSVCGQFNVELFDRWGVTEQVREIKAGDRCQVFAGGEPVITGYVDVVSPSIGPEQHSITISGRDKTCDLVDCSAEIDSFEVYGIKLDAFARMLCDPFGIEVKVETDVGKPFERIAVNVGEKAFDCLDREARKRGVICTTDNEGALVLSARGEFASSGAAIVEGDNLQQGTAVYDFRDRYRDYKAHGQMPSFFTGTTDPRHGEIGLARDENMMRARPLLITCEAFASCDDARIRAENECAYRAGKSTRVNITVVGWRHAGGALWRPRQTVSVTSSSLYVPDNTELVISTVRYTFSDGDGTKTELEMTRPDAYLDNSSGQVEDDFFEQ